MGRRRLPLAPWDIYTMEALVSANSLGMIEFDNFFMIHMDMGAFEVLLIYECVYAYRQV